MANKHITMKLLSRENIFMPDHRNCHANNNSQGDRTRGDGTRLVMLFGDGETAPSRRYLEGNNPVASRFLFGDGNTFRPVSTRRENYPVPLRADGKTLC